MAMASLKTLNDPFYIGDEDDDQNRYVTSFGERRRPSKMRQMCYAVNANSPSDMYFLLEQDWAKTLAFTRDMERLYADDKAYMLDENCLHVGRPVAARYIDGDLLWYRAKLTSLDDGNGSYKIDFVDFGNQQINSFSQMRALPDDMAKYPPMALHCRLWGAERLDPGDINAAKKICDILFREFPKGHCVVDFLTDTPPYVVRIWNLVTGDEVLPEKLGPTRSAGQVSYSNNNVSSGDSSTGARNKTIVGGKTITPTSSNEEINDSRGAKLSDNNRNATINGDRNDEREFLGDIVQNMKRQCNVDGRQQVQLPAELFSRYRQSSPAPCINPPPLPNPNAPPVRKRDAATQTADVLKTVKNVSNVNDAVFQIMFPNLSSILSDENN